MPENENKIVWGEFQLRNVTEKPESYFQTQSWIPVKLSYLNQFHRVNSPETTNKDLSWDTLHEYELRGLSLSTANIILCQKQNTKIDRLGFLKKEIFLR